MTAPTTSLADRTVGGHPRRDLVEQVVTAYRRHLLDHVRPSGSRTSAPSVDALVRLAGHEQAGASPESLAAPRDSGEISEQEYEERKNRALDRIWPRHGCAPRHVSLIHVLNQSLV